MKKKWYNKNKLEAAAMRLRKFEIINVELVPGGPGPERAYKVYYRAIKDKKWVESFLWSIGKNEKEARDRVIERFGSS